MVAVCAWNKNVVVYINDGEVLTPTWSTAKKYFENTPTIICNKVLLYEHLPFVNCLDILELYAFVYPTKFVSPSISGLINGLKLDEAKTLEEKALSLLTITNTLFTHLQEFELEKKERRKSLIPILKKHNWLWADSVAGLLGLANTDSKDYNALKTWQNMEEIKPQNKNIIEAKILQPTEKQVERKLFSILGGKTHRQNQVDYSLSLISAFNERQEGEVPNIVFAEAGTGTGKTLGYIAPSIVFTENNQQNIWISTYTLALQRQIDKEFSRIYTNKKEKKDKVLVRKGRENYLCLLKYENLVNIASNTFSEEPIAIFTSLISLWTLETQNGDIIGGDFHSWLGELFDFRVIYSLPDRRGECLHSACPHYSKCFIEKALKQTPYARIVIANHSLVLNRHVSNPMFVDEPSGFYVFDEAHHLIDVGDGVFSSQLSGLHGIDLYYWIAGRSKSVYYSPSMNGLKSRLKNILTKDEEKILDDCIILAKKLLPSEGWLQRLIKMQPKGSFEVFLSAIYNRVLELTEDTEAFYTSEIDLTNIDETIINEAEGLYKAIYNFEKAVKSFILSVEDRLIKDTSIEINDRQRLENQLGQINRRIILEITTWRSMLRQLKEKPSKNFVEWFSIERTEGKVTDVGFNRYHLDPSEPLSKHFLNTIQGSVITSATLNDDSKDEDLSNKISNTFGLHHIATDPKLVFKTPSPFNYKEQAKVIILSDAKNYSPSEIFSRLFLASRGGALGLFTSIKRLKETYQHLEKILSENDITLLAQHISKMEVGTLIDIFRDDKNACLLGTDSVRDGIDVPGESLRLVVFDKVPWERQTVLNKARKEAFGEEYINAKVRAKLRQAFGRLIRTVDDKGIFIMVDNGFPSRFFTAFPKDVEIVKSTLNNAEKIVTDFLNST